MKNRVISCVFRKLREFAWVLLKVVICIVILMILVSVLFYGLLCLDLRHADIDKWVEQIIDKENYFKGEVWFSVIATCITAIPGIFCGLFALCQTHRIHRIEQRYHRPSLKLHQAKMEVWKTEEREDYNESLYLEYYLKMIKKKSGSEALMQLSLDFQIQNEIELRSFRIDKVEIRIAEDIFCLKLNKKRPEWQRKCRKRFWREYKDNQMIYHVEWDVYPYKLKGASSKRETEFWSAIKQFMDYDGCLETDYRYPEIFIEAKIGYEHTGDKKEKIECRSFWASGQDKGQYTKLYAMQMTNNGYFTYDIRK